MSFSKTGIKSVIVVFILLLLPAPPQKPNGILIFSAFVTDVSGGFSPSMLDAIRNALSVSIHVSFGKGEDYVPMTYREAFYLATLGGATGIANFATVHLN